MDRRSIDLDLRNIQFVSPPQGVEGIRTQVKKSDLLVSITADIGIISLIPENLPKAYINQHISLARPVKFISPKYLAWYLSSHGGQKQFQKLKRGATKTGLGLDDIRSVLVPIPPLNEQKEIVTRIEEKYKSIQKIEEQIKKSQKKIKNLDQSILSKAFLGQLIKQNPNDESASDLLEKLKK
jgi:type I restriction enzyme, S subunit